MTSKKTAPNTSTNTPTVSTRRWTDVVEGGDLAPIGQSLFQPVFPPLVLHEEAEKPRTEWGTVFGAISASALCVGAVLLGVWLERPTPTTSYVANQTVTQPTHIPTTNSTNISHASPTEQTIGVQNERANQTRTVATNNSTTRVRTNTNRTNTTNTTTNTTNTVRTNTTNNTNTTQRTTTTCVQACRGNIDCILHCGTPNQTTNSSTTTSSTNLTNNQSSGGTTPSSLQVERATARLHGAAVYCTMGAAGLPSSIPITFTFASSGMVETVRLPSTLSGTNAGRCIERAVRNISVPPFTSPHHTVTQTLALH